MHTTRLAVIAAAIGLALTTGCSIGSDTSTARAPAATMPAASAPPDATSLASEPVVTGEVVKPTAGTTRTTAGAAPIGRANSEPVLTWTGLAGVRLGSKAPDFASALRHRLGPLDATNQQLLTEYRCAYRELRGMRGGQLDPSGQTPTVQQNPDRAATGGPPKETIMNRSPARLTLGFLALSALGLGLTACSTPADSKAPPIAGQFTAGAATTAPAEPTINTSPAPATAPTPAVSGSAPRVGPARSPCPTERDWTADAKSGGDGMSLSALYLTRVGQHACYDRVVFDINGPRHAELPEAVGFTARYVPVVTADPSGEPVPVAGHAVLEVTIKAPIYGTDDQGHQPWRPAPKVGQSLIAPVTITDLGSVTAVAFADSFEGQTTLAVGVRDRRPFRVWVSSDQGYQHVILDIAR
jgi:hypothetical protein